MQVIQQSWAVAVVLSTVACSADASAGASGSGQPGNRAPLQPTAAGKGGEGSSSPGVSDGAGTAAAGSGATVATFTQVYALFTSSCTGVACHVGATVEPGGDLAMLDKATAYANLVGVASSECIGEKRVGAGAPEQSELLAALNHTQINGCTRTPQMPINAAKLADSDLSLISRWIEAGAKDD